MPSVRLNIPCCSLNAGSPPRSDTATYVRPRADSTIAHSILTCLQQDPQHLPPTTENDQVGTNQCGTGNNQTSLCQNLWVDTVQDFCLWGVRSFSLSPLFYLTLYRQ